MDRSRYCALPATHGTVWGVTAAVRAPSTTERVTLVTRSVTKGCLFQVSAWLTGPPMRLYMPNCQGRKPPMVQGPVREREKLRLQVDGPAITGMLSKAISVAVSTRPSSSHVSLGYGQIMLSLLTWRRTSDIRSTILCSKRSIRLVRSDRDNEWRKNWLIADWYPRIRRGTIGADAKSCLTASTAIRCVFATAWN